MDMSGSYEIEASKAIVWQALNDISILKLCIPGCEEIKKNSDTELEATVVAKVGPVKAKFKGIVQLSDIKPNESYTISGEGKGGAAGFAKGEANVKLQSSPQGTILNYSVSANVGGKLAQIGGRLIDSTAKKLADQFFLNFAAQLSEKPENSTINKNEYKLVKELKMIIIQIPSLLINFIDKIKKLFKNQ